VLKTYEQDGSELVGTGFVTVLEGHPCIVTNRHVVENATSVKAGVQENLVFTVKNRWLAKNADLAVLEIPSELQSKPLPLRRTLAKPGETVYAIGFPMGLAKSITQGLVTATYADALQFDAPISSGNSGGPLLDVHGEVIGVVTSGSKEISDAVLQNLNFAVPVGDLHSLATLEKHQDATPEPPDMRGSQQAVASPTPIPTQIPKSPTWPDGRSLIHPEYSIQSRVVNVSRNDTLKLRSGPGIKFPALIEMPANATGISAFEEDLIWDGGDTWWCPVASKGVRGYVSRRYLSRFTSRPVFLPQVAH
jgi:Trypsin-like peptidase domain